MSERTCSVDGCTRADVIARGLCGPHYKRLRRYGDPLLTASTAGLEGRILERVDKTPDGCWTWTGSTRGGGYGRISIDGRETATHRAMYELRVGPIPDGLDLDHLCRNRQCCNPEHLEPVPHRVNSLRGESPFFQAYREGRCLAGHDYEPGRKESGARKRCPVCARKYERRRRGR